MLEEVSQELDIKPTILMRAIIYPALKEIIADLRSKKKIDYFLEVSHGEESLHKSEEVYK